MCSYCTLDLKQVTKRMQIGSARPQKNRYPVRFLLHIPQSFGLRLLKTCWASKRNCWVCALKLTQHACANTLRSIWIRGTCAHTRLTTPYQFVVQFLVRIAIVSRIAPLKGTRGIGDPCPQSPIAL